MKIVTQIVEGVFGIDYAKSDSVTIKFISTADGFVVLCNDYDEDCIDVKNKQACHLYNVNTGVCPYLSKEL